MDNVTNFVTLVGGYGYGDGYGDTNGDGYGYGYGYGDDYGNGYGSGNGDGCGDGFCNGYGSGYGDGYGSACGNGNGKGYRYGGGLRSVNGYVLYDIDGVPTGIYRARGNVAKGFVLERFSIKPCYIVKDGDIFAHGSTIKEAEDALHEKIMENMDEGEAIEKFVEHFKPKTLYRNSEFFEWHHYLTGSCRMGRENFCANHGVDMDGQSTPEYFIELTKNDYGGDTIRKLEKHYKNKQD